MKTPVTPAGLARYDDLPPAQALQCAWRNPGRKPEYHLKAQRYVRTIRPILAYFPTRARGTATKGQQMLLENKKIRELAEALDLDDDGIYARYSGHGMYSDVCFGVIVSGSQVVLIGVALSKVFGEDAWDIARSARGESMGRDMLVYFPGWEIEDADEFED